MWIETVVTKCTCELPECVLNIRNKRLNQIFLNPPLLKTPKLTLVPRRRWIIWRIQRTRQIRRIQDLNFFIQASTSDRAIYGLSRRERNEAQQMKYYTTTDQRPRTTTTPTTKKKKILISKSFDDKIENKQRDIYFQESRILNINVDSWWHRIKMKEKKGKNYIR